MTDNCAHSVVGTSRKAPRTINLKVKHYNLMMKNCIEHLCNSLEIFHQGNKGNPATPSRVLCFHLPAFFLPSFLFLLYPPCPRPLILPVFLAFCAPPWLPPALPASLCLLPSVLPTAEIMRMYQGAVVTDRSMILAPAGRDGRERREGKRNGRQRKMRIKTCR